MSVFVIIVLGPVQGEALDHLSVVATKPGSDVFLEASGVSGHVGVPAALLACM